jgi:hypothetical protein
MIWMLWLQGWHDAPEIVSACRRTWERHNPSWDVYALSRETIHEFIDIRDLVATGALEHVPPEALSDIIRIRLLERHGGVWVDGTAYCNMPLDAWLPAASPEGFFAFARPGPDRMVSSWFLGAGPGNYIISGWARLTRNYWRGRLARHHYFWFHYLFAEAYQQDAEVRRIWDATPKISADGPHYFTPYETKLLGPISDGDKSVIRRGTISVFKLTHKYDASTVADKSALNYLIRAAMSEL